MENRLDKLFRDKLAQKETAYNPSAWDKVSSLIPDDEDNKRNKRRGLWIFFSIMILGGILGKILYSNVVEMDNIKITEIGKTNSNFESEEVNVPSEIDTKRSGEKNKRETVIQGNTAIIETVQSDNANLQNVESIKLNKTNRLPLTNSEESKGMEMLVKYQKINEESRSEIISKSNSGIPQTKNKNPNVTIAESNMDLEKIENSTPAEKNLLNKEEQIIVAENQKESTSLQIELLPLVNLFVVDDDHLLISRNRNRSIKPIKENDFYSTRISAIVEGGKYSRLSGGLQLERHISGNFGVYTGIKYVRWNNQPSVLAIDQVSNYGFGVERTTRTFEQKVMNEISVPLGLQFGYNKFTIGMDMNLNYLLGIHGYVNTVADGEISTRSSWIKEYGVNKWNMGLGTKIDYRIYRRVRVGGAIQYYLSNRYNNEYYNGGGFALPKNRDFQFSIKLTYDLFK